MSRPPIHRPVPSPRGEARYFSPDFAALVALAEELARERHGIEIPAKGRGLARTLIEMPALLAHVLGEHQSLYAREAHLGSARLAETLVRHALRLAHAPDPGVAATGLAAFTVKPGLSGTLPAGFALQSSPLGEAKAETYETLADLWLDAAWNALRPAEAELDDPVQAQAGSLTLGTVARHGLDRDEIVLLEGRGRLGIFVVSDPAPGGDPNRLVLRALGMSAFADPPPAGHWAQGYRLHARPAVESPLFGWNAPPALWPPDQLARHAAYAEPTATNAPTYGYEAPTQLAERLLVAGRLPPLPAQAPVALVGPSRRLAFRLGAVEETAAVFLRGEQITRPTVTINSDGRPVVANVTETVKTRLAERVTAVALLQPNGQPWTWNGYPLDARLLAGWTRTIEIARRVPNRAPLGPAFLVAADLSAMRPGRPALLRHRSSGAVRAATIAALDREGAAWRVRLEVPGGFPADWPLGEVDLLANVARISHGESKSEILGASDGVTPHQSFTLKNAPVTRLPSALGTAMALELRVDGVLWEQAGDFHEAGPEARQFVAETDAEGRVTLRFGGEGRGAIPPSGQRNVTATYRQGLGAAGNAGPDRVRRIRKASPLIAEVTNPLPIAGGTDPAGAADIARQATRPVRLFDRAVSVEDHADLALLFPGIVRARARAVGAGIELVAADAAGQGPADPAALQAFLDARRDTGVPLLLVAPQAVPVRLSLRIERDRAWLAEAVRLAVEEALLGPAGLFTFAGRDLGERQSLSALAARLLALPGVAGLTVPRFRLAGTGSAEVADILTVTGRQWLQLRPADLSISMVGPGLLHRAQAEGGA